MFRILNRDLRHVFPHIRLATSQAGANRLINSKIPHQYVTVVQSDGKLSDDGPVRLASLLRQIDQTTEFIELVSTGDKALVKIRNKKQAIQQEKELKKKRVASRVVTKELQLSWVISKSDLAHKLAQARQYFQKGNLVTIQFIAKQGQLPPPPTDCQRLIDQVHETLADVATMHRVANAGKGVTTRTIAQFFPREEKRPGGSTTTTTSQALPDDGPLTS